jgi:probable rRNA maturation factor
MNEFSIDLTDRQACLIPDERRLRDAVTRVLSEECVHSATISLALVDDAEIQRINREFLGHDYPTDVISFVLEESGGPGSGGRDQEAASQARSLATCDSFPIQPCTADAQTAAAIPHRHLEGELIVSTETAIREAAAHGWSPQDEVLLYVVHGLLHLCGYDDLTDEARPAMRVREREVLAGWQLVPTGLEA